MNRSAPPDQDGEKKVGILMTIGAFLMAGPVGGVIMAMAVGAERAFNKAGWEQPAWLGGGRSTPETIDERVREQRRLEKLERDRRFLAEEAARRQERAQEWKQHRRRMHDWSTGDRTEPKPARPERRGFAETLGGWARKAKAHYTLFDEKMAAGNERVNGFYDQIKEKARKLWNFFTGFGEGFREGWEGYRESRQPADETEPEPEPQVQDSTAEAAGPDTEIDFALDDEPMEPTADPDDDEVVVSDSATPVPAGTDSETATTNGDPQMGASTTAAAVPQGESNATVIVQQLEVMAPMIDRVSDGNAAIAQIGSVIANTIAKITEITDGQKAPVATRQALEEATQVVAAINAHVATIGEHAHDASDQNVAARTGMMPAVKAEEQLRAAQAGTTIVAENTN